MMKRLLGIDLRSLALFRISMGLILIWDLVDRAGDLRAHYTSQGVLPLSELLGNFSQPYALSLHFLNDSLAFQSTLFLLAGLMALALIFGFLTRLATVGSWVLLISLHWRNPLVLQFGDMLLRVLLFWSIFLPLGARWSWDAKGSRNPNPTSVFSMASAALLLQVCLVYWFTAALKTGDTWWSQGNAVYYALNLDTLATPLGRSLSQHLTLIPWLTYGALGLEILGPALAFFPLWNGPVRTGVVVAMGLFHGSLGLTLHLGHFPFVGLLAWTPFIPAWFWEKLGVSGTGGKESYLGLPRWLNLVCLGFLAYVLLWNFKVSFPDSLAQYYPRGFPVLGKILHIDQRWGMYAPNPTRSGGWYVIPARMANGEIVDLFQGGAPVSWDSPESVAQSYPNERWGNYLTTLWLERERGHRRLYAQYLCRNWNASHSAQEWVLGVELINMDTWTPPPGRVIPAKRLSLGSYPCASP
ncbi:MAG: HTTM domain-containing protein [bacterium]|nr:HTTM domain-containing protein [bacterium]